MLRGQLHPSHRFYIEITWRMVSIYASIWLKEIQCNMILNYHVWPQRPLFRKSLREASADQRWKRCWCRLFLLELIRGLCLPYNSSGSRVAHVTFYSALHHRLRSWFLEACLLLLLHAHFPSPSPVPSGVPSNQRSFDGEAAQGEAQGIMTETAGALVTASMFSKPAQRQSGNFPLNHRKSGGEHGLHT